MTDLCRLCGVEKDILGLVDIKDFHIQENVEFHCRIILDSHKMLPQSVCSECLNNVTKFKNFSDQVREVQEHLKNNLFSRMPGTSSADTESVFVDLTESFKTVPSLDDSLLRNCLQDPNDLKNCLLSLENETNEKTPIKIEDFGESSNYLDTEYLSDYSIYDPDYDPEVKQKKRQKRSSDSEDYEELPKKRKVRTKKPRKAKSKNEDSIEITEEMQAEIEDFRKKKKMSTRQGKILFESADTVDKLFKEEIEGNSQVHQYPTLNISETDKNPDGTITQECLEKVPGKLWKDLSLVCGACEIELPNIFDFRSHYDSNHPNEVIFSCSDCKSQTFQQVSGFVNHLISKHYEHLKLSCIFCSELFWNIPALYEHCKLQHPSNIKKIFQCFCCGMYCESLVDLKDHKLTHIKKESAESFLTYKDIFFSELNSVMSENKFNLEIENSWKNSDGSLSENYQGKLETWREFDCVCYECLVDCGSPYDLMMHFKFQHPDIKQKYTCKTCSSVKPFLTMRSMLHHGIKQHTKSLSYCCIICSKQYWNYTALYNHYRNVHSTYRTCICLACGLHFDDYVRLRFHATSHNLCPSSEKGKKYIRCYKCSSVFEKREEYNAHGCRLKIKAEKAVKPQKVYMCEICGKNYSSSAALANHVSTHDEKKEFFYCDLCGQKFVCKYRLKYHRRIHTAEKLYECEICHVKLRYKHTLTRHYITHSGERPFSCTFCDKKFSAKSDMKIHQRLHTGDFPYECQHCGDRYPSWSNLFKHAKSRHKIDIRSEGIKNIRKIRERLELEQFSTEPNETLEQSTNFDQ